jgi:hypothetical protein
MLKIAARGLSSRLWCSVCIACLVVASSLSAGNIFDDNWTPPAQRSAPPAKSPTTSPATSPPTAPVTPPPAVPVTPSTPLRPEGPLEVPPAADQARSRKLLREVFAADMTDASAAGRRTLVPKLLKAASDSNGVPADQFVLLAAAFEAGTEAGDMVLCGQVADSMAAAFKVDPLQLRFRAASRMPLRGDSQATCDANAAAALELIDQLLAIDDFAAAARMIGALQAIRELDAPTKDRVRLTARQIDSARTEFDALAKPRIQLQAAPDDPAANLAVGRYLCFSRNEWEKGLLMLQKASDPTLKALAAQDRADPSTAPEQENIARQWWDLSIKEPSRPVQQAMRRRAAFWYARAIPSLTGLSRALAEKRVAEVVASSPPGAGSMAGGSAHLVHLLPLIQDRDLAAAGWRMQGGAVVSRVADRETCITVPYALPLEYDLRYEFTRISGGNDIAVTFPVGGVTDCAFALAGGNHAMLGRIAFRWKSSENPTYVDCPIANGERHAVVIKVRRDSVDVLFDARPLCAHKTDGSDLLTFPAQRGGASAALMTLLSFGDAVVAFHTLDLVELKGKGGAAIRDADGVWSPPFAVTPESNGVFTLRPFDSTWHGSHADYVRHGDSFAIGGWLDTAAYPSWTLQSARAGKYTVHIKYSCDGRNAGSDAALSVDDGPAVLMNVSRADGWDRSEEATLTSPDGAPATLLIPAGRSTLRVKCARKAKEAVMDLWAITLEPVAKP